MRITIIIVIRITNQAMLYWWLYYAIRVLDPATFQVALPKPTGLWMLLQRCKHLRKGRCRR
jgi:hypothetical protein